MTYLQNRRGQGTTEYMLILAVVVMLALALSNGPLQNAIHTKISEISTLISKPAGAQQGG